MGFFVKMLIEERDINERIFRETRIKEALYNQVKVVSKKL